MGLDPENLAALRAEFPGCEFFYSAFDFLLIARIPGPPPVQVTADEHDDLRAKVARSLRRRPVRPSQRSRQPPASPDRALPPSPRTSPKGPCPAWP
jgi:hypothetical protein